MATKIFIHNEWVSVSNESKNNDDNPQLTNSKTSPLQLNYRQKEQDFKTSRISKNPWGKIYAFSLDNRQHFAPAKIEKTWPAIWNSLLRQNMQDRQVDEPSILQTIDMITWDEFKLKLKGFKLHHRYKVFPHS